MSRGSVIIIGAGLTGLAAGRALINAGIEYVILEAEERLGGLCRTEEINGFIFDYTGHLLHLREGEGRDLILNLLGENLAEHTRKASVFVEGTFVPYPIQAHFGKLPGSLAMGCMEDLIDISGRSVSSDMSFPDWARAQFGDTLAEIFMLPYNKKLFVHSLEEMEVSWTSWSVPRPTVEEVRAVASGQALPAFGYNATFYYPRQGGIGILPEVLSRGQEDRVRTSSRVTEVDALRKTVTINGNEVIPYRSLITTMSLPNLIRIMRGLSPGIVRAASRFRHSSVLGICVGLDGPIRREDHWIYFPEKGLPFYRIGFPTNFSHYVSPEGCGSAYVEVAYIKGSEPDPGTIVPSAMKIMKELGIIDQETRCVARLDLAIPFAYVFHDRFRVGNLDKILEILRQKGVRSVGRYGAWEYSAMQDAVEWGQAAARETLS
jgi:protoporphyrinogen oxidase